MRFQGSYFDSLLKQIATLWFIGYMPLAPGTWGSLAGLIFVLLLPMTTPAYILVTVITAAAGVIASSTAERITGETDSSHIVIDEFTGLLVSLFMLPHTYCYAAAGFLLFRIFDILKPFPIRQLERNLKGGPGIMADDILAGIFANVILQAWTRIFWPS